MEEEEEDNEKDKFREACWVIVEGNGVPVGSGPVIDRRSTCGALQSRCWVAAPCRAGHVVVRDDWWTHGLQCLVGGVSPEGLEVEEVGSQEEVGRVRGRWGGSVEGEQKQTRCRT